MSSIISRVVLTGGPCAGKSTVLRHIKATYGELVEVVPEVATILLEGCFPVPGKDVEWSPEWQQAFQSAILPLQRSIEDAYSLMAQANGAKVLICDRGTLDGAAYTPGGQEAFCRMMGLDLPQELARYQLVIYLESLATANPALYGASGNDSRFEGVYEAQKLEFATRAAWHGHPAVELVSLDCLADTVGKVSSLIDQLID